MCSQIVRDQVNIVVSNIEKSLAFYRRLGLSVPAEAWSDASSGRHASGVTENGIDVDFDNTVFARVWSRGWAQRNDLIGRIVLGFKMPVVRLWTSAIAISYS